MYMVVSMTNETRSIAAMRDELLKNEPRTADCPRCDGTGKVVDPALKKRVYNTLAQRKQRAKAGKNAEHEGAGS